MSSVIIVIVDEIFLDIHQLGDRGREGVRKRERERVSEKGGGGERYSI